MKVAIAEWKLPASGAAVVMVAEGRKWGSGAASLDKACGGALGRAMSASRFEGKAGQWLEVMVPGKGDLGRVLLAGVGKPDAVKAVQLEAVGGDAAQKLAGSGDRAATLLCDLPGGVALPVEEAAARLAYGGLLGSYRFDKYRTTQKPEEKPSLRSMTVTVKGARAAKARLSPLQSVAEGVFLTRDLVSEPANVLYPESFAQTCRTLTELGVKVEVLSERQMQKLGMGALLAVGRGSARESRLAVMRWEGGRRGQQPVAFVGKGVCFDTGGISLKPPAGMEDMKWDMGGAGTVTGLMKALAGRKAKANVVGVIGLVENMPSGDAQRPGDVVTSLSGQTIEVINTDAEGRLVLADALWYTQDRFKPQFMVDLATLTGAIIISLGHTYAGLFSNNDELASRLQAVGESEGEGVWRMPMGDEYDRELKSDIADMRNVGGRAAGSVTAAQFLLRYVNGIPWAHLDIAGMAWSNKAKPTVPKGGTGWGVRLLDRLIAEHYEAR